MTSRISHSPCIVSRISQAHTWPSVALTVRARTVSCISHGPCTASGLLYLSQSMCGLSSLTAHARPYLSQSIHWPSESLTVHAWPYLLLATTLSQFYSTPILTKYILRQILILYY
jgi:hypothetical protein